MATTPDDPGPKPPAPGNRPDPETATPDQLSAWVEAKKLHNQWVRHRRMIRLKDIRDKMKTGNPTPGEIRFALLFLITAFLDDERGFEPIDDTGT